MRQVGYLPEIICVLHVSANLVAILGEAHYKGRMYRDITEFVNHCVLAQYVLAVYKIRYNLN